MGSIHKVRRFGQVLGGCLCMNHGSGCLLFCGLVGGREQYVEGELMEGTVDVN